MTSDDRPLETPSDLPLVPRESRFESDPDVLLEDCRSLLPQGWTWRRATEDDADVVVDLLRAHEKAARGWAGSDRDDVLVELSARGLRMRENVLVLDPEERARAWGSVHDRATGRMLLVAVPDRELDDDLLERVCRLVFCWARGQARAVGQGRGLAIQQIDTGAFSDDDVYQGVLHRDGFDRVRTWWQMKRPTRDGDAELVPDPARWERKGVRFRRLERGADGMPETDDIRAIYEVIETAFTDHFNSAPESFDEFVHRLREDPGHRWDHWWVAELLDSEVPEPAGALVGTLSEGADGDPGSSYVAYIGVTDSARGRGVATGLLRSIIADAAIQGRSGVALEVDADSPTGADSLYVSLGWETSYMTQSWHEDVPVDDGAEPAS